MTVNRFYKPELDVLRLGAFLLVFFVHRLDLAPINPVEYYWGYHLSLLGNFGVPLFFLLSAFLITELLIREQEQFSTINIKSFYIRRMLRIWPVYFTFFFGMVLITQFTDKFGHISLSTQLAFTLFSGNWHITLNGWIPSYPINPLWSISVEEQLYILLPLVIYYWGKKGLKAFSFLVLILSYATIIYYAWMPPPLPHVQWTNSLLQFQFFAAGILLAIYLKGRQPNWGVFPRAALFLLSFACWITATQVFKVSTDPPHVATVVQSFIGWLLILTGVICFFLTLYGASARYMPRAFVYLGRISYGLYVYHITMYLFVYKIFKNELAAFSTSIGLSGWKNELGMLIAFILTVAAGILSYQYFEKPFLKLKRKYTIIPSRD